MKKLITTCVFIFSAIAFSSCTAKKDENTLKVAATAIPHAEILEVIKPDLEKLGVNLDIIVVDDYLIPNRVLSDGEVDANFFQHEPFLEVQKNQFGYDLETFAKIHLEPMALYSFKLKNLNELPAGASIAVPADPTNQARALLLLENNGLIKLKKHDISASIFDIAENPQKFTFLEVDAPLLARALEDVDLGAITTNFALQAGLSPRNDSLAIESGDSLFVNILVIRTGDEGRQQLIHLKDLLTSEKVENYIKDKYDGAIIKAW